MVARCLGRLGGMDPSMFTLASRSLLEEESFSSSSSHTLYLDQMNNVFLIVHLDYLRVNTL